MITAAVVITLLYVFIMLFLLYGFFQVPNFSGKNTAPKMAFSIVIPLRNEAENLPALFESLLRLKYPRDMFEILLVNDASTDASEEACRKFIEENRHLNIELLENNRKSGSPKKDAIQTAIEVSKRDFILTTDADCVVPENWLREFNSILQEHSLQAVAGPVILKSEVSKRVFLRDFQEMDILSLQAATIGGFGVGIPLLCNGANFCYSKKAFLEVNGFAGNEQIASGDDIFLVEKFQKEGLKIAFLKSREAIVLTQPAFSRKEFFSQRIRWAAKTSAYNNTYGKGLGLLVFLMNFLLVILLVLMILGQLPLTLLLFMFLLKFNADFYLIYSSARFYERESSVKSYFFSSVCYPLFSSWIAICSLFTGYSWKGRQFKK